MGEFVNLNEVGALTRSGQQYGDNAEQNVASAKNHLAKMEGLQSGFKGAAGSTFQGVSQVSAANHGQLGRQIAEQARRAVLAERAALVGDEESTQGQRTAQSAADAMATSVSRPINV
jgi:uncharacterized protein YukE